MIWILVPAALLVLAGIVAGVARALRAWSAMPVPRPDVPRPAGLVEMAGGVLLAASALGALAGPALAGDRPALGPIVTPIAAALGALAGALVAAGPRGRSRLVALLFVSNRRYVGLRTYVMTDDKWRRLRQVGRAPLLAAMLGVTGLVIACEPLVAADPSPAPTYSPALAAMPPDLRGELERRLAAGDPEAVAVMARLGGTPLAEPTHPPSWSSERHVAWPSTALVLMLVALALVLTPGGLARPEGEPGALDAA